MLDQHKHPLGNRPQLYLGPSLCVSCDFFYVPKFNPNLIVWTGTASKARVRRGLNMDRKQACFTLTKEITGS